MMISFFQTAELPATLDGGYIFYQNLPRTVKMYMKDPVKNNHHLKCIYEFLQDTKRWNVKKPNFSAFNNNYLHGDITVQLQEPPKVKNHYSELLRRSGVFVDDINKSIAIPDKYRFNKDTERALLELRRRGYLSQRLIA